MSSLNVPQLHNKLEQIRAYFTSQTELFTQQILHYTDRFTAQDQQEFDRLLQEIKRDVMARLTDFIDTKINSKSVSFQTHITSYTTSNNNIRQQLAQFSEKLSEGTKFMKQKEFHEDAVVDHFTLIYSQNRTLKKCLKALRDYQTKRLQKKALNSKMDQLYSSNLMKRSFFPWRTLTYKDGYENSLKRRTQLDLQKIHEQYAGIVEVLKRKIQQTDQLIKVKKAAKGEFAYALSKNLLKTISNLSLEVMSLNQVSLKDQEYHDVHTQAFLEEVNTIIQQKITKVNQFREGMGTGTGRNLDTALTLGDKDQPASISPKRPKNKRISFV